MITFQIVKVGNHWYPDIKHEYAYELQLDSKLERLINIKNKGDVTRFDVFLYEIRGWMPESGVIEFNDNDIERYLTTNDDFDLRFTIDGTKFHMSSDLYTLLEDNFNLELCKTQYKIEIW